MAIFLNTRPCVVSANVTGSRSRFFYLCAYVLPLAMGQFFGISTAQYNLRVRVNFQLTRRPESLPTLRRIPFEKWPFRFSNISPGTPGLGGCGRPNSLARMPILNSNTDGSRGYQRQRDNPETVGRARVRPPFPRSSTPLQGTPGGTGGSFRHPTTPTEGRISDLQIVKTLLPGSIFQERKAKPEWRLEDLGA